MEMGKTYGYARVSTKNQRLDRQIRNIEDYCKDRKIEKIYKEKYTGTKMGRPQFQKLLAAVSSGDTIIFDSVSRMSRSADEGYTLYMKLLQEGIDLIFIKEPHINTSYYKQIQRTEKEIAEKLDKLPDVLKEDGYPDVQAFMATYRKAEAVVEQYNRDLAEWEREVRENRRPAEKERLTPPEKKSIRDQLRRLQAEGRQRSQPKRKSHDRER
jgi:ElaB/YqjD/DUF883 family membrane-anchored ribosome-binding protein